MELLLPSLLLFQVFHLFNGYPSGAPTGACEDMMPHHIGAWPQHYPTPYTLLTNARTFGPGQRITVTLTGPQYRGVLLVARTYSSHDVTGSWENPPPDTKFLKCARNPHGAVTHSNPNLKGNTTVYSWTAHDSWSPVYFVATVAQQRTVYWVNVRSISLIRGKSGSHGLAKGAGAGLTEGKSVLLFFLCFLMIQVRG